MSDHFQFRLSGKNLGAPQVIEYLEKITTCPTCATEAIELWKPFIQAKVAVPPARLKQVVFLLNNSRWPRWAGSIDGREKVALEEPEEPEEPEGPEPDLDSDPGAR